MGRTAPLTSKRCILYIYSTNIGTEYFKHALYSPFFFSLQNAVWFLYYSHFIYRCAKIKKKNNNSGAKGLNMFSLPFLPIYLPMLTMISKFLLSKAEHKDRCRLVRVWLPQVWGLRNWQKHKKCFLPSSFLFSGNKQNPDLIFSSVCIPFVILGKQVHGRA